MCKCCIRHVLFKCFVGASVSTGTKGVLVFAGMAVKMPFTGTVLDHLTKPRPDTRFCTGLLQKALPALRPAAPPVPPAAVTGYYPLC